MTKRNDWDFDWRETGRMDAAMWRAYYNHQFFRMAWMLLKLTKTQLRVSWFRALRLAFYAGWAAADYRIHKKTGTNNKRIVNNLAKFYKLMSDKYPIPFDYRMAAELELRWWEIHRRSKENSAELEKAVAEAAAVVYSVDASTLKEYAHYRSEAGFLPAHMGDKQRAGATDWKKVEDLTIKSWHALWRAVQR